MNVDAVPAAMTMAAHYVVQQQQQSQHHGQQHHPATLQQHHQHQELLYTSSGAPSVAINTCTSAQTQAVNTDVGTFY